MLNDKKSGLSSYLYKSGDIYNAIFSDSGDLFWSTESDGAIKCSSPGVTNSELFNFIIDTPSGKNLIQGFQTGNYAEVMMNKGSRLYCNTNSPKREALFDVIDIGSGLYAFKCFNRKYISCPPGGGFLCADKGIPVYFRKFKAKPISILGSNGSYASPAIFNNTPIIRMDSADPVRFYLLEDSCGLSYIETADKQYTYPKNISVPLTYAQTKISQNNNMYIITAYIAQNDVWIIKSDFNKLYVGWDTSAFYGTCLFAKFNSTKSDNTHFRFCYF